MTLFATTALLEVLVSATLFGQATNVFPSSGNVGIGTVSPSRKLVISDNAGAPGAGFDGGIPLLRLEGNAPNWSEPMLEFAEQTNPPIAAIAAKNTGAGAGDLLFLTRSSISAVATERIRVTGAGNVGIGTTAPQYKLAVNGTIGAKEVVVTNSGWADYVFKSGYQLQPLSEISAYIEANHHLPDIPSEAEVLNNGVSVGEMQAKLLAKIEELTLHMIEADRTNVRQQEQILLLLRENRQIRETLGANQ